MTPLPVIPTTTEEVTGCTIEGGNKALRNPPSWFLISCFTVSVKPSANTNKCSNDFMILIISFISSFELNKMNPFLTLFLSFPFVKHMVNGVQHLNATEVGLLSIVVTISPLIRMQTLF